jgi:aminopeptidase N
MFITQEAFKPLSGELSQFFSQGINERFAHEIAHQYWGHVVKMPSIEEQWLTESFAEYSAALVIQQLKGKGGYNALVATWKGNSSGPSKQSSIMLANRLATPNNLDGFIARTHLVYDKGALLLSKVHKEVGDDVFLTYLRSAQGTFAWKFGSTKRMIELLNHVTKKDYTQFFEEHFYGTAMPK